ncbi:hypothetical protein TH63_15970 [Rufibacter radiotolerans]|uniref:Type IX secretion system membrane protein PorP/SprF n=1 Tax=Rufibacter radiotolerans TaxID=1379910 RepID=A0A0H4VLT7_9BACT|nr:hypothetical protein [Rufibacter radiotolerans]AKQ46780.1 hypothetical protein TH63_15970 [Rufibacter radiotolerans]
MAQLKKPVFLVLLFLCLSASAYSQTNGVEEAQPAGGVSTLALEYFKIRFTREQKKLLQNRDLEFLYSIAADGTATLEKIDGVTNPTILDSLTLASGRLHKFKPRKVNGVAENGLYGMTIRFPSPMAMGIQGAQEYTQTAYEGFEYIHRSGQRFDIIFGGVANTFLGKAGDYLGAGGGMKLEMLYAGKKGVGGGMLMSFYGNGLTQDFPIASDRKQNAAPPTLMLGLAANKMLASKERREFLLQLELNYVVQNITPKENEQDENWTQFHGFSPGLVAHYAVQLGKPKAYYYYGTPSLYHHYLNFHVALRPMFMNHRNASGTMAEAGVSYRLGVHLVDEYRIK